MSDAEGRPYFKIGEVCDLTETQPYVLRFWETEFPTLAPQKNRSGQRIYRQRDVDLIRRIKTLLYEKEYTIAGARKVLETEGWTGKGYEEAALPSEAAAANATQSGERERGSARGTGRRGSEHRPAPHGEQDAVVRDSAPAHATDTQLEAEVKNLRAKLAHAEAELRAILAEMDRHDGP